MRNVDEILEGLLRRRSPVQFPDLSAFVARRDGPDIEAPPPPAMQMMPMPAMSDEPSPWGKAAQAWGKRGVEHLTRPRAPEVAGTDMGGAMGGGALNFFNGGKKTGAAS